MCEWICVCWLYEMVIIGWHFFWLICFFCFIKTQIKCWFLVLTLTIFLLIQSMELKICGRRQNHTLISQRSDRINIKHSFGFCERIFFVCLFVWFYLRSVHNRCERWHHCIIIHLSVVNFEGKPKPNQKKLSLFVMLCLLANIKAKSHCKV